MLVFLNSGRLREWREEAGLRPEAPAAAVGITAIYLTKLESGERGNPSARILAALASFYGRSMDELFSGEDADIYGDDGSSETWPFTGGEDAA
jgi:transcriptional regulator with XRE-family HTH domain